MQDQKINKLERFDPFPALNLIEHLERMELEAINKKKEEL